MLILHENFSPNNTNMKWLKQFLGVSYVQDLQIQMLPLDHSNQVNLLNNRKVSNAKHHNKKRDTIESGNKHTSSRVQYGRVTRICMQMVVLSISTLPYN